MEVRKRLPILTDGTERVRLADTRPGNEEDVKIRVENPLPAAELEPDLTLEGAGQD